MMIQTVVGNPKALKPELDRTIRSKKHRIVHFCESFSLKNRSVGKKQGRVQTAVRPYGFENCKRFSQFL